MSKMELKIFSSLQMTSTCHTYAHYNLVWNLAGREESSTWKSNFPWAWSQLFLEHLKAKLKGDNYQFSHDSLWQAQYYRANQEISQHPLHWEFGIALAFANQLMGFIWHFEGFIHILLTSYFYLSRCIYKISILLDGWE